MSFVAFEALLRRILTLVVAFTGAAGTLGCALFGQEVVIVTPTPSPPPTATFVLATSTPIPTATPIPTPTVAPFVAVHEANTALLNGDYNAAVAVYRSVLEQPALAVDPTLRTEAAFGLGTAALREGLFADAVDALTSFVENRGRRYARGARLLPARRRLSGPFGVGQGDCRFSRISETAARQSSTVTPTSASATPSWRWATRRKP